MNAFFATPSLLWLGLLIGPLLLLYMLRHKPVRKRVPSIVLWTGVAQSQIATSPFQRLRRSLSLLLMLLALIALVLGLAGFRIPGGESRGVPVTLIIDITASMQASEPGGTRQDTAVKRATEIIEAAGNSDITLFTWDGNLRALTGADVDPAVALSALDSLEVSHYGASDGALVGALKHMGSDSGRRVVLISDHSPGQLDNTYFAQAGTPKLNAGIVSASLTDISATRVDLFFGLELSGSTDAKPLRVPVVLERVQQDGGLDLVDARDVELRGGQRTSANFSGLEPGLYALKLKLEDGLDLDNIAWLRASSLPVQDVVVTGTAPTDLLRAIEAIEQANGVIRLVESGDEDRQNATYIFADAASSGAEPRLPAAYLAPLAAPRDVALGELVDVPEAATRPASSFLWRGAGTPDLRIPKVHGIDTGRYLKPVLEAGTGVAIALTTRENELHDLLLAFPLDETAAGFTGRVAFVIFWANWFEYVRRAREPLPRGAITTRETLNITPIEGRGDFSFGLAGADSRAEGQPGRAFQLDRTGVYAFDGLPESDLPQVGASLLDASESDLSVSDDAGYDADQMRAWMQDFTGERQTRDLDVRPWLALLAAALLLFEWFWFRRKFPTRTEPQAPAPKTQAPPKQTRVIRRNTSRVQA